MWFDGRCGRGRDLGPDRPGRLSAWSGARPIVPAIARSATSRATRTAVAPARYSHPMTDTTKTGAEDEEPPANLVTMRREFDQAVAAEPLAKDPEELARVRSRQQQLALEMCAHPYYHQAVPDGFEARKRVMAAAKKSATA